MRVLIVKMSSLGDVIHTLPALTDAKKYIPKITFDWVVEPEFSETPALHKSVSTILPLPLRTFRKEWWHLKTYLELFKFKKRLKTTQYNKIIDAQGLLKSALIARWGVGEKVGYDKFSSREPVACFFYNTKINIPKDQHAIYRTRRLFAQALGYALPKTTPEYNLVFPEQLFNTIGRPYCVFLHGTTWETKHWPEENWQKLAQIISKQGLSIKLPWGNHIEKKRAERIAANLSIVEVLSKMNVCALIDLLRHAQGVICVDTGLGHLAAALGCVTIVLYGPTSEKLAGTRGANQHHLVSQADCAPCFKRFCSFNQQICFNTYTPKQVAQNLVEQIEKKRKQSYEPNAMS